MNGPISLGSAVLAGTFGPGIAAGDRFTIVSATGRSRACMGGAPVPVGVLAELGEDLLAVHGQADQLRLVRPGEQRALWVAAGLLGAGFDEGKIHTCLLHQAASVLKLPRRDIQAHGSRPTFSQGNGPARRLPADT